MLQVTDGPSSHPIYASLIERRKVTHRKEESHSKQDARNRVAEGQRKAELLDREARHKAKLQAEEEERTKRGADGGGGRAMRAIIHRSADGASVAANYARSM